MKKIQNGFTLIELLVVIAIISILTAIVLANLAQPRAKARDAKRVSDIAQIQFALEGYFDRCNQYPRNLSTPAGDGCPPGITLGTFMSQIPNPPLTSNPAYSAGYWVNNQTAPTNYLIKVTLEGSSGAIVDSYSGSLTGTYYQNGGSTSQNNYTFCPSSGSANDYCVVPK